MNFLLPPRRPVHPVKDDNREEEIKDMVGGSRLYHLKKCKTTDWSLGEYIPVPDELLFEILLRLPAPDIYHASRLVCRKWYHMMHTKNFINKQLEHANYGLLCLGRSGDAFCISSREDGRGINTFKVNYRYRDTAWSSCNGLMLEFETYPCNRAHYYVVNVSTNQALHLPLIPFCSVNLHASGIGYDRASMTYKVVATYKDKGFVDGCAILTVGVDKAWRQVRIDHLSEHVRYLIQSRPVVTEGFLHWNPIGETEVLTLNTETEVITETHPPISKAVLPEERAKCFCMSTGRYLSFFHQYKELAWEVFEMKPETGEWRKLPNICLEGQMRRITERLNFNVKHKPYGWLTHGDIDIKPIGWLKYPEVLALRFRGVIISIILLPVKSALKSCLSLESLS